MTESWDITYEGFDAFMRALVTLYPEVVEEETLRTMEESLIGFQQAVMVETPVGVSGHLKAATASERAIEIVGTPVELIGMLVNPMIYGWPVERGRMPGKMPPPEALELWVIRKGLQWTYKTKSGKTKPMTTGQMAFIMARSIARKGTKGAAMFHKGFELALPAVKRNWEGLPGRIIKRLE